MGDGEGGSLGDARAAVARARWAGGDPEARGAGGLADAGRAGPACQADGGVAVAVEGHRGERCAGQGAGGEHDAGRAGFHDSPTWDEGRAGGPLVSLWEIVAGWGVGCKPYFGVGGVW